MDSFSRYDFGIDLDKTEIVSTLTKIEKLYEECRINRQNLLESRELIKLNQRNLYTKTKKSRIYKKIVKFPPFSPIKFENNKLWIYTLHDYYLQQLIELKTLITKQNENLKVINDTAQSYNLPLITTKTNKKLKKITCKSCTKSILPCRNHRSNKQHNKSYINPIVDMLPDDQVIAIDVECYDHVVESVSKTKHLKEAFRVAAVTQTSPIKNKNQCELLYHGFWRPNTKFNFYFPVTGIGNQEVNRNLDLFCDRADARDIFLRRVVKERTIVFAAAKGDIESLGFNNITNHRDIQDYFCRYPGSKATEPVKLRWLSRYILNRDIQEYSKRSATHDPVIEAIVTLQLYNRIPKEFWSLTILPTKSSSIQLRNESIPLFIDDFEPDYEPLI